MAVSNSIILQLVTFKNVVKSGGVASNLLRGITSHMNNVCLYSTASATAEATQKASNQAAPKKMSNAMIAYLERARAHDAFIKKEKEDFLIGKRHLANMMGADPEHFSQHDIEAAIEYLFPSGLFDKAARPIMKPPEEIFPPRKAAEFDETGRPHHTLFYTTSPNYYQTLYDIVEQMQVANELEDKMIRKGVAPDPTLQLDLDSSDWVTHSEFEKSLLETIKDEDYEYFISSIQRLANHPYSYQAKDFIMKFRKEKRSLTRSFVIPPLEYDSEGRPFIVVTDCMRKSARGSVTLKGKGSGKITVNGISYIRYFTNQQDIEQIIFPLQFVNIMDELDIEAQVHGGGPTGQSGAIRWGIAWGLRSFVDLETVEKMRIAGLLTRDWRRRERKKPGQEGARRKFTWKKR